MSKKGPDAPTPPDPNVVSAAQTKSNEETAKFNQQLNMVNTYGPNGSVVYAADDTAPGGYKQTTTLSPAEQEIFDRLTSAQGGALDIGNAQLGRVSTALATSLDTSGLPALQGGTTPGGVQTSFDAGPGTRTTFDQGAPLVYGFNPGQQVQGHLDTPDARTAIDQAVNAVYGQATSRLDPQWQLRQKQLEQQLADQGLNVNDDAYRSAMDEFGRQRNDAYTSALNSAITSGQNEQNTLFGQDVSRGAFANQAAAQEYAQNQGRAAFHNQTAGQDYSQNLGAAQFANAGAAQQFAQNEAQAQFANQAENQRFNEAQAAAQLSDQARQQGLNERAFVQNEPINQLTGLLSLGQVSGPQGIAYTPSQAQSTNVLGAYALNQQAQNAAYQAKMAQQSGLRGGLFSLGSAALLASDRRLKKNVRLLRRRPDGLGVYRFRYVWGGPEHVGVMAQELRRVKPHLVVRYADGSMAVDYAGLGAL